MAFFLAGPGATAGLDAHPTWAHSRATPGVSLSAGAGWCADDDGALCVPASRSASGLLAGASLDPRLRAVTQPRPKWQPMTDRPPMALPDQFSTGLPRRRNWPLLVGSVLVLFVFLLRGPGTCTSAFRDPLETNTVVKVRGEWMPAVSALCSDRFSLWLRCLRPRPVQPSPLGHPPDLDPGDGGGVRAAGIGRDDRAGRRLVVRAMGPDPGRRYVRTLAIPVIIVSLAVVTTIGIRRGLIAFIVGLAMTGWAETARLVSEPQTRSFKSLPYVEASGALGAPAPRRWHGKSCGRFRRCSGCSLRSRPVVR